MESALLERKNRDFFRQVTLVAETPVTSIFEANWQFLLLSRVCIGGTGLPDHPDILYFFLLRLIIGAIRAGVKHIANSAVPA